MKCVTLGWFEVMQGALVGIMRQVRALQTGKRDSHGFRGDPWGVHIEGALGEAAAAKALGIYWPGSVDTFKDPDLGRRIQVRTRSSHNYELIVRDGDSDDDLFLLVTGTAPEYRVVGWIEGREAKRPEWLKDYGGRKAAYFVPHSALRPIEELGYGEPVRGPARVDRGPIQTQPSGPEAIASGAIAAACALLGSPPAPAH